MNALNEGPCVSGPGQETSVTVIYHSQIIFINYNHHPLYYFRVVSKFPVFSERGEFTTHSLCTTTDPMKCSSQTLSALNLSPVQLASVLLVFSGGGGGRTKPNLELDE